MTRKEEYENIRQQLEDIPMALDYVETRLMTRVQKRKKKWQSLVGIPTGVLLGGMMLFVVLVNSVPTFARSMGSIPVLRELAKLVAFSPSLVAAIEHDFVQVIEVEKSQADITASVAYLIVDQKQVNIFYSLTSDRYHALDATPEIRNIDGSALGGYGISSNYRESETGLRQITVDFMTTDVPSELRLSLRVHDNGGWQNAESVPLFVEDTADWGNQVYEAPEAITVFDFDLALDPYFTALAEILPLGAAFQIDAQEFVLEEAQIYPTHMQFDLADREENTAYLVGMEYYIVNEKGEVFDRIRNGISASGKVDSPMMASYRLESAFFSKSKSLTLYITEVMWLDKAQEQVSIDLVNLQADYLPEGVELVAAKPYSEGWKVVFSGETDNPHSSYGIWRHDYYDQAGKEYFIGSESTSSEYWDEATGQSIADENKFYHTIPLQGFEEDRVYMSPVFTRRVKLEEPIRLEIK